MLKVRQIKYDTSADGQPITRLQIRHYSREVGKVHQVGFDNTTVVFTATNVGDQIYQLNKHHLGISFGVNNIIYAKAFYKDGEWTYNEFVEAWDNILKSYVLLNKHEQLIWNSIKIGEMYSVKLASMKSERKVKCVKKIEDTKEIKFVHNMVVKRNGLLTRITKVKPESVQKEVNKQEQDVKQDI
eukprot:220896_1